MLRIARPVHARLASRRFAAGGGMRAVDTGATLTPSACQWLKANGYTAAIRYLGRMSAAEANTIRASGLDIIGVLEHNGNGGYSGYNYGAQCMQNAIDGCRAAGGPGSGILLWIAEFDFDASNPAAAQPFIDGAHDRAHANGYLSGMYGPWGLGTRTHNWDGWWQTMSTGFFGNAYTTACTMTQHFPYVYPAGIQCDGDDIHDPARAGLWSGPAPAPAPPPAPPRHREDHDMYRLLAPGDGPVPMALPLFAKGAAILTSDGGGINPENGVPVRAAIRNENGPWVPLLGPKPDDPRLGPDEFVNWFPGGDRWIGLDGSGGLLVVENLSEARKAALGMATDGSFPAGNDLGLCVTWT